MNDIKNDFINNPLLESKKIEMIKKNIHSRDTKNNYIRDQLLK
jgi:hypothetical protein